MKVKVHFKETFSRNIPTEMTNPSTNNDNHDIQADPSILERNNQVSDGGMSSSEGSSNDIDDETQLETENYGSFAQTQVLNTCWKNNNETKTIHFNSSARTTLHAIWGEC